MRAARVEQEEVDENGGWVEDVLRRRAERDTGTFDAERTLTFASIRRKIHRLV